MGTVVKCKYCGKENEISEAFENDLRDKILAEATKLAEEKLQSEFDFSKKKLEEENRQEMERRRNLEKQLLESFGDNRKMKAERESEKLDMEKKLLEEQEKIAALARKTAFDEFELKDREKDQKLQNALKRIEEMKVQMQQGSQQTQGEVLETEIEEMLKREFPLDIVSEVKKGQRGADIVQEIIDKNGKNCGKILWESKNAVWSDGWIEKLKEDQRQAKADLAVLVATNLPPNVAEFVYRNGVFVISRNMISAFATTLRFDLVRVNYERQANIGKNEKTEVLYQYITSVDFRHRIEAMVGAFTQMQNEIEREKRWFQTKWSRQEKQFRTLADHTHGMWGDLQGVVGKSLPDMQTALIEPGETV